MVQITETVEISKKEYEKMCQLMGELHLSIHQFIEIAVKDAIQTECGRNI